MSALARTRVATPLGAFVVLADGDGLRWGDFEDTGRLGRLLGHVAAEEGDPFGAGAALEAYFAGDLGALAALPVAPGGTDFQRSVWGALRAIPPGATRSYGRLAAAAGRPGAARAAGAANGANPVSLVVPCHRVVGADGRLTGYGGGLDRKRRLLAHEGAVVGRPR
ncbi:MAG TPA: methylated-DNA--[protein]-cysteine S-methyltransferase [Solirubrobacteraceae bacterium]